MGSAFLAPLVSLCFRCEAPISGGGVYSLFGNDWGACFSGFIRVVGCRSGSNETVPTTEVSSVGARPFFSALVSDCFVTFNILVKNSVVKNVTTFLAKGPPLGRVFRVSGVVHV